MTMMKFFVLLQTALCQYQKCDVKKCKEFGGTTINVGELSTNMTLREQFCPAGHGMVPLPDMPCCLLCGQQRDQVCNDDKPCDATILLTCQRTNKKADGTCQPQPGRECFANDEQYRSGDDFWPNCNTQCFCLDGGIGCRNERSSDPNCLEETNLLRQPAKVPIADSIVNREGDPEKGIKQCSVQTTQWSPCSRTCDWGFSERVTNNNDECRLEKEIMLCKMRACDEIEPAQLRRSSRYNARSYSRRHIFAPAASRSKRNLQKCAIRKGGKIRAKRADKQKITFSGCSSKKAIQMKFCPVCPEKRCCPDMTPVQDMNNEKYKGFAVKNVAFRCEDKEIFHKKIMIIKRCRCNEQCKQKPNFFSRRKLNSDMMPHHV